MTFNKLHDISESRSLQLVKTERRLIQLICRALGGTDQGWRPSLSTKPGCLKPQRACPSIQPHWSPCSLTSVSVRAPTSCSIDLSPTGSLCYSCFFQRDFRGPWSVSSRTGAGTGSNCELQQGYAEPGLLGYTPWGTPQGLCLPALDPVLLLGYFCRS